MFFLWKGKNVSLSGDFNGILSFSARDFVNRGHSVIPLKGDLDVQSGKAPAIPSWKAFQRRLPTNQELEHWFTDCGYPAMGVVLGAVSGLAVIDIDAPELAAMFQQCFPDLIDTFTVQSGNRGLPHYYYQIPTGMSVPSRYGGGVELRSDGQYVVAPHVSMDGKCWQVVNDVAPKMLNEIDLRRILHFLDPMTRKNMAEAGKPGSNAKSTRIPPPSTTSVTECELSVAGLRRRYTRLAKDLGRNNAMFSVSAFARDHGWSRERVEMALVDVHVFQPPQTSHPPESAHQRRQEAQRTIASVFGRPAKPIRKYHRSRSGQMLPNTIREKLLQIGLARVARVLDGLLIAGFTSGQTFSAAQAYRAVSPYGIGRNTVFDVLKTVITESENPSPPHPPTHNADAAIRCAEQTKPCLFGRVADSVKTRGRPAVRFIMPTIERLCALLGVRVQHGDNLQPEDLKSLASYRAALHAALIRRAPGKYPRNWQAQRLGVSKASCRRYEKRTGIRVQPTFQTWAVTWGNMERIFPDQPEMGHFLEDDKGKRYPPLRVIARRLLAQGKRLLFKSQDANHYEFPTRPAMPESSASAIAQPATMAQEAVAPWVAAARKIRRMERNRNVGTAISIAPNTEDGQKISICQTVKPTGQRQNTVRAEKPIAVTQRPKTDSDLDAAEACVERLYTAIRNLNPQRSITRKKARQFVSEYGVNQVERGLRLILKRRNVRNPAGFMQVLLRSQHAYG